MVWSAVLLLFMVAPGQAQEPARSGAAVQGPEQSPDYEVGPGDLLSLSVFGLQELDQTMRVSNSGRIHIAHVGTIPIANMTVAEVEKEIARKLREQQLLNEPWVRVRVTEYQSQPVFVVGEVAVPGQYMMTGETRLLDAITKAGGFTTEISLEAYVIRRRDSSDSTTALKMTEVTDEQPGNRPGLPAEASTAGTEQAAEEAPAERISINVRDLRLGSRPELNIRLRGGDVVYVPRRKLERVFIVGEVGRPGAYGLPVSYEHITAGRALAYAGGPLRTAKTGKAFIMRRDQDGGFQSVPFDFIATTRGLEPDIPIRPNDVIFVPRSIGKKVGYAFMEYIPQFIYQFMIF